MAQKRVDRGIYELSPGVYKIVVSAGKVGGVWKQRSLLIRGKLTDARKARAGLLTSEPTVTPSSWTVKHLFDEWVDLKSFAPTTLANYRQNFKTHIGPNLGHLKIGKVEPRDLDRLYAGMNNLAPATVRKVHNIIRGMFTQAVKWGYVPSNPTAGASPPSVPMRAHSAPAVDDVQKLLAAAWEHDVDFGMLCHLAAVSGARRGELAALRFADVHQGALRISRSIDGSTQAPKTTKTGKSRTVPLDANTLDLLSQHKVRAEERSLFCGSPLTSDRFVFSPRPGNDVPFRPDGITSRWMKLAQRVGVPLRFHDLRHFVGSQLIAAGVDARTVADRLGHSTPVVTLSFYAHAVDGKGEAAATTISTILAGL